MSILSVDQISPIGSGTTITLNATEVKTGNEITVGTGASIFSPAGNTLTLGTNNVERIRIKNDGKIGIGTNNPSQLVEVQDGSTGANLTFDGTGLLKINVPSATGQPSINFENSDTGSGTSNGFGIGIDNAESPFIYNRENTALRFGTNNVERFRIGSSGQIGLSGANYGTSGQVLTSQGSGSAVAWSTISAGTEVYDTWIYTAETNVYAVGNYLTSNWSRFGDNIGSAMTQSSGVFSFPSTGFYRVTFTCNFFERNSPDNIAYIYIQISTNSGSSYTTRVASLQNVTDRSGDTYTTCHAHCLFDVTNTTTHKVRFFCGSDDLGDLRIAGASNYQQVYATFQKMANT